MPQSSPTSKIAVLISDVHFSYKNHEVASQALEFAFKTARDNDGKKVICLGDLNDTKASLRSENVEAILKIIEAYKGKVDFITLVGNHDLNNVNEYNTSQHSLNFLKPVATVIEKPTTIQVDKVSMAFIPYQNTNHEFTKAVLSSPKDSIILAHQGV